MSSNRPRRGLPEWRRRDRNSAHLHRNSVGDAASVASASADKAPFRQDAVIPNSDSGTSASTSVSLSASGTESTNASSSASNSSSPSQRHREALRLESIGVDPSILVGKVLNRVSRSKTHPCLTLDFSDQTTYRVLVDGYDTKHRGVPTVLEMDALVEALFNPPGGHISVDLLVRDCTFVRLSDKAFERGQRGEAQWDQSHLGIAFKFEEGVKRWHCVWAMLEERDGRTGQCVFRSFDDVYLQPLVRRELSPSRSSKIRNGRYGVHVRDQGRW